MPLWEYIDGYTQVRDHTSVNGVNMEFICQALLTVHKKSCKFKKSENSVWWVGGTNCSMPCEMGDFSDSLSVYFVWCKQLIFSQLCILWDWSSMLYQSIWVLLFIYVLYKMALFWSGYTMLTGRVITGIINWKDWEGKLWFPNFALILPFTWSNPGRPWKSENSYSCNSALNPRLPD
jgi:hypothetical protein